MPVSNGISAVVEGEPGLAGTYVPFVESDGVVGSTFSVVQAARKTAVNNKEATDSLRVWDVVLTIRRG